MVYGQPVDLSILRNAQRLYAMTIKNLIGQMANSTLKIFDLKLIKMEQAVAARAAGQINDGTYWDNYVRQWEELDENRLLEHVGNEWKNEEIFLSLLEKYASPESSALEIGCGGGRITSKATRWFKHVYACDVSKEMLRKNRESVKGSNVSYHMLDGFTLGDFADESLDFVFSHDVFVHFSSLQVYPYFTEIRRVLKKNGIAIISFYNCITHFDLFREMSLQFNRDCVFPPHARVHFVTQEMINLMLEDLSLRVQETDVTNFLIPVFKK